MLPLSLHRSSPDLVQVVLIVCMLVLCISDRISNFIDYKLDTFSVKLEKKTEAALIRTTSSLPDGLTLSPSLSSKEHLDDDTKDDLDVSPSSSPRSSSTVPCPRPSSICSSHYASPTESRSVAVIVNMSELSEPEEVRSPVVSEAEEVSSSSGSYSVTSVTTDISKSEFCELCRFSNNK